MAGSSEQRGFVLLMSLGLLALASVVLLAVVRDSAAHAAQARQELRDLQWRWGQRSMEGALLSRADRIIEAHMWNASGGASTTHAVARELTLGDWAFQCVISDEQAKVNLNAVFSRRGESGAAQAVHAATAKHHKPFVVVLQPSDWPEQEEQERDREKPVFGSMAQVARPATADVVLGLPVEGLADEGVAGLHESITLWGDGRLRLRRASGEAIDALFRDALGAEARRRLREARDADPDGGIEAWLEASDAGRSGRTEVMRRVTAESRCFALAVHGRTRDISRASLRVVEYWPRPVTEGLPAEGMDQEFDIAYHGFDW